MKIHVYVVGESFFYDTQSLLFLVGS